MVTGGSGGIGRAVARKLAARNTAALSPLVGDGQTLVFFEPSCLSRRSRRSLRRLRTKMKVKRKKATKLSVESA